MWQRPQLAHDGLTATASPRWNFVTPVPISSTHPAISCPSVKGGGCSGLSYTINFDEKIGQHDQVHDFDGVKVIVDAKSAIYLQGTQLDFQKDLMGGNFKFVNPNADKTCGCGESFSA